MKEFSEQGVGGVQCPVPQLVTMFLGCMCSPRSPGTRILRPITPRGRPCSPLWGASLSALEEATRAKRRRRDIQIFSRLL